MRIIQGAQPYFGDKIEPIIDDIRQALINGDLAHGSKLEEFERLMAESVGAKYALGVSSGGTALELALRALEIAGKEVIVPTDTFVASANSVVQAGGYPIFADIKKETLCLDPADVLRKIGPKTAGVMLVHMFGLVPPEVEELRRICRERGLFLIEDAAHAHGAAFGELKAGNLADIACFSFYATKVLTTGEGGMVTTSSSKLRDKIAQLRNHGRSLTEPVYEVVSNNYRLTEIQAIIGIHQMHTLDENLKRRSQIANFYNTKIADILGVQVLPTFEGSKHSYWRFPILLDSKIDRLKLQKNLADNHGVRVTWMYEPLCHLQPVFGKLGYQVGDLPNAEWCIKHLLCLPCYPGLTESDLETVCTGLQQEVGKLLN